MEKEGVLDVEGDDGRRIHNAKVTILNELLTVQRLEPDSVNMRLQLSDCYLVRPSSLLLHVHCNIIHEKAHKSSPNAKPLSNASFVLLCFKNFAEADTWTSTLLLAIGCCLFSKDESSWPYGWKHKVSFFARVFMKF
jgi:hypothetical protein